MLDSQLEEMGDWKITVFNNTDSTGLDPVTVDFMLFQTVPELTIESWSAAWEVAEVGYKGEVGPIILPVKVEFYVLDESYGNPRKTGPFPVSFGQAIEVKQENKDASPEISQSSENPPKDGEIKVVNAKGNPKPLEFALYKNGKKILSYKGVPPADSVYLSVKPTIYIAQVQKGTTRIGDDFKALVQSDSATQFGLFPDKLVVNIGVFQKPSKELYFKQLEE